jgi:DNA-binding LacI/PurR family transcriptional regulator
MVYRRTRLSDVAKRAGVSVATASQSLAGKPGQYRISTDVVERVRRCAQELGYAPNRLVRSLQGGQSHVLSFFNGYRTRTPEDLYMNTLATALERAVGRRGYDLLVHCDFSRPAQEICEHLNGGIADAVLFFAPRLDDPLLALLKRSNLPVVLLGGQRDDTLAQVIEDASGGLESLAERLVALGHRRIGVLGDDSESPEFPARLTLLREALARRGAALEQERLAGQDALFTRLKEGDPPTALFCPRDSLAYAALDACQERGIAVPERLSIVGYDGLPWKTHTGHTVTSVRVDLEAMAEAAVQCALALLSSQETLSPVHYLPTDLIEGTTLGEARPGSRATEVRERAASLPLAGGCARLPCPDSG